IFETEDGRTRVEVRFEHENVWLTQKLMADLYECSADNISLHLKNIFADRELDESAVTEESAVAAADGKKYSTRLYSLEAIIAVGYRVQSPRATQFRTWATNRLKDYILKGFAIDSERFKHGSRFDRRYFEELLEEVREIRASERMVYQKITDIYATAADYSPNTAAAERSDLERSRAAARHQTPSPQPPRSPRRSSPFHPRTSAAAARHRSKSQPASNR